MGNGMNVQKLGQEHMKFSNGHKSELLKQFSGMTGNGTDIKPEEKKTSAFRFQLTKQWTPGS